MPHLAPLKWLLLSILFWFTLLMTMSMYWWQMFPKISSFSPSQKFSQSPFWPWL